MPALKDTFSKLKSTIVGTSTQAIDSKLDDAVKNISVYRSQLNRNSYIEVVKSLISKTGDVNLNFGNQGLFGQAATPASFGQAGRLQRYKSFRSIVDLINYCKRALDVLTDNILSPDDITKVSLEVKPETYLEDETPTESKTKYVKDVIKKLKIEEHLNIIVKTTLECGDFFVEIADEKKALTSMSLISEFNEYNGDSVDKETFTHTIDEESYKITMDYSAFSESKAEEKEKEKKDKDSRYIESIKLLMHDPRYVVKLQSAIFPICFGYLIFPQVALYSGMMMQEDPINNICVTILKSLEKKIPQLKEFKDIKDLKDVIGMILSQADYTKSMNVRYVPPDKMEHFRVPSTRFFPYGESIYFSTEYTAKVLIAMETALAVQRLSRSTEKRKVQVEIGLPRDAKKAIEKLKESFKKRKVSLDSFGSVDTIPSMISTFEDIYIPAKDGKPFVDISTFTEGNVDIRSKVDELKFMRDSIVSSLGVPAPFLGIEENINAKATLTEENISFARTIVGHQKYLNHQINGLIDKIVNILDPEKALTILDNVSISLPSPRSLQFERESRYMSELANLVETLERIGIPKEYSKKKYLSQIDWDEVKKYETDEDINKIMKPEPEDAGGGGF